MPSSTVTRAIHHLSHDVRRVQCKGQRIYHHLHPSQGKHIRWGLVPGGNGTVSGRWRTRPCPRHYAWHEPDDAPAQWVTVQRPSDLPVLPRGDSTAAGLPAFPSTVPYCMQNACKRREMKIETYSTVVERAIMSISVWLREAFALLPVFVSGGVVMLWLLPVYALLPDV